MKKYLVLVVIATLLYGGTAYGEEAQGSLKAVWAAIAGLQKQINEIQLIPGPQGEVGPVGPQGLAGKDFVVPDPKTIDMATDRLVPFVSEWIDTNGGYNTLSVSFSITGTITQYDIQFTNDMDASDGIVQATVRCDGQKSCALTTVPILGRYYRISTGTGEGAVTAQAHLVFN